MIAFILLTLMGGENMLEYFEYIVNVWNHLESIQQINIGKYMPMTPFEQTENISCLDAERNTSLTVNFFDF